MTIEHTSISRQFDLSQRKRPPTSYVKPNFDEAVFDSGNISGIGGVIRNDEGNFVAGLVK